MEDALTLLIVGFLVLEIITIIPFAIFMRLGGHPEGTYRILRIPHFAFVIYTPDGEPIRRVRKMSEVKVKSPPHFDFNGRTFYLSKENAERVKSAPQWRYTPDNSLPIPLFTNKVTVKLENGTILERSLGEHEKLDPRAVFKAYNTDIPTQLLKLGDVKPEKRSLKPILIGAVALIAILALLAGLYLSVK